MGIVFSYFRPVPCHYHFGKDILMVTVTPSIVMSLRNSAYLAEHWPFLVPNHLVLFHVYPTERLNTLHTTFFCLVKKRNKSRWKRRKMNTFICIFIQLFLTDIGLNVTKYACIGELNFLSDVFCWRKRKLRLGIYSHSLQNSFILEKKRLN